LLPALGHLIVWVLLPWRPVGMIGLTRGCALTATA